MDRLTLCGFHCTNLSPDHSLALCFPCNEKLTRNLEQVIADLGIPQVTGTSKNTPARLCGLMYGDVIEVYAQATRENVGDVLRALGSSNVGDFQNQFDRALDVAANQGRSFIMAITRASVTSL